jgi:hypothetical protein
MHKLMGLSLFFFEAQRSGRLPGDKRVLWRGDSPAGSPALDNPYDGGWYDAGDHVKFNLPMFYSAARVALATWKYADAIAATRFDGASNLFWVHRELKAVFTYIMKCHPTDTSLVAQVGDGFADHGYIGRAELMNMNRPVFWLKDGKASADLIMVASGALANCYMVFKNSDPAFATNCMSHSQSLYKWGMSVPPGQQYDDIVPEAKTFYKATGTNHRILFAAASLYHATNDVSYKLDAQKWGLSADFGSYKYYSDWVSWDNEWFEGAVLMMDKGESGVFKNQVVRMLNNWVHGYGGIKITPKGQRFLSQWGSNRYAANAAAVALMAAPHMGPVGQSARCFAISQLHYLWGDTGRSFIVGFGKNPPRSPHHRNAACKISEGASCSSLFLGDRVSPYVLHGAVIGGPKNTDDVYVDDRNDYVSSEVACDYNALYTVATAAAIALGDSFWSAFPGNCKGLVPGYTF